MADAAEIAVALVRSDAGGRWRAYGMVAVPAPAGSVRLERGDLLAEGVALFPGAPGGSGVSPDRSSLSCGPLAPARLRRVIGELQRL